ncbi:type IV pilin protein [Xanthomonas axonopodis pv. betlicola]
MLFEHSRARAMTRTVAQMRGFTLIELMIVVAVVAILSAIAYPSYTEHVRKSRRAQAKVDLVEYGQLAERFHTVQNTYVGFSLPSTVSPREGGTAAYSLALSQQTQSGYVITATPGAAQVADKCGTLSIDQASRKTNSKGLKSDCW